MLLLCRTECYWRLALDVLISTSAVTTRQKNKATLSKILDSNLGYKRIKVLLYAFDILKEETFLVYILISIAITSKFLKTVGHWAYWAWLPVSGRQGIQFVLIEHLLCRAENEPYFCMRYFFKENWTI